MSVNKVHLIGRLGTDPELDSTQSGTSIADMVLATNDYEDNTHWHDLVCFGGLAETVSEYLEKGRQVYVEGRISYSKWEGDDGKQRKSTEIVVDDVTFLGGGDGGSSGGGGGSDYEPKSDPVDDSEIPF